MAIQTKNITLDGLVHTLDDRDRVAAQLVNENDNFITGKGIQGTAVSAATSVPVAVGNTDISVALPAGALIKDMGFVVTSALGGTGASGTVTVSMGTSSGGAELVAAVEVCDANSAAAAGSSQSVLNAVEADASGAPFGDFKDAATLYSATARSVYMRFAQGAGVAAAIGEVIVFCDYIVVS